MKKQSLEASMKDDKGKESLLFLMELRKYAFTYV